jgi:hypothetical protein
MAAGGAFDEPLETRPETRPLQRPIEPAGRDAQVSLRAALRGECGGGAAAGSDASPAVTGPFAAGPCTCATICGSVGRRVSISRLAVVIITLVTDLIGHGDEQGEEEDVAVPSVVAPDVVGRSDVHAPG